MKNYMVFMNDGNSYQTKAENEELAREKMEETAVQSFTSITAVYEMLPVVTIFEAKK